MHTRNKPLAPDVKLKTIAQSTVGFSGADLENLVNEAALLAARRGRKAITEREIEEASIKVVAGPEKKSHVVTDKEKRLTAYHEGGHAITGYFCPHPTRCTRSALCLRPGGRFTMYLPDKDASYVTKTAMQESIVTLLGGRVAEQLVLEDISTGASNDLERATSTARSMVTRYGFSERFGPVVTATDQAQTFLLAAIWARARATARPLPPRSTARCGTLWRTAETARRILTEHMPSCKLAKYLMERGEDLRRRIQDHHGGRRAAPAGRPEAAPKAAEVPAAPEAEADGRERPKEPAAPETAQEQPGENPENQEPKL